jgi:hypothetical protein
VVRAVLAGTATASYRVLVPFLGALNFPCSTVRIKTIATNADISIEMLMVKQDYDITSAVVPVYREDVCVDQYKFLMTALHSSINTCSQVEYKGF